MLDADDDNLLNFDDFRVRNVEKLFAALDGWLLVLNELKQRSPDDHDVWIAESFIVSSQRAYTHLRRGWRTDSTYVAWACRNILELRIFVRFVIVSPANRKRFIDDGVIDSEESTKAMSRLIQCIDPGSTDEDVASSRRADQLLREASKFEGKKYLNAMSLVGQLELGDDLHAVHKLCSKLVHPTAQSVMLVHHELQCERDTIFLFGSHYLFDLMDDLAPWIETLR